MTLKEYKKLVDKLVKEGHGDKEVYYAIDDEGNAYKKVVYAPSVDEGRAFANDYKARVIIN